MSGFLIELLSEFFDLDFIGVTIEFPALDFSISELI